MEVIMSISKHANKKKNILIAASEIVKSIGNFFLGKINVNL